MDIQFIKDNWVFMFFAIAILGGLSAIFKVQFRFGKKGLEVGTAHIDDRYIDLIMTASIDAGFEMCNIRNVETVDMQIAAGKGQMDGLRDIFLERYNTNASVWQVLDCTYHIFRDELVSAFRNLFIRENSKTAKGQQWDILSIIELKGKSYAAEWRRVCMLYFPGKILKDDYSHITELIDDQKIYTQFTATVHDILIAAQSVAIENEERIRTIKKEVREYVRRVGDKANG